MQFLQIVANAPCFSMLQGTQAQRFCAFTNNSESQEVYSIRIFQVETCRGLACHSVIFVNFVWDIAMHEFGPVSIIRMEDCPCASMLQPTQIHIFLNLHAQSRATVCTLHGNMYSSSMFAQLMFVSWYFQILPFFEQVCYTKMTIKLAFLRV